MITYKTLLDTHNQDMIVLSYRLCPNYFQHDSAIVIHSENMTDQQVVELCKLKSGETKSYKC